MTGKTRYFWFAGLIVFLGIGVGLRLIWGRDIEYKFDEAWTFENSEQVKSSGNWPTFGMDSSTKAPNPGMSLWVFVVLSRIAGADDPPSLARAIQVLNSLALIGLALFTFWMIPREERHPWYWATALVAVNPFAVLFQRKIWPPSVFPMFSLIMIAGWWQRHRRTGAFVWGLVGACLGQIHMSGFFYAAALAGWTAAFQPRNVRWIAWFAGTVAGLAPLAPWIWNMVTRSGRDALASRAWYHILEFKFWTSWISEPLGLTPKYSLGQDFEEYVSYPLIAGQPTYLVAIALVVAAAIGLVALLGAARTFWQQRERWQELFIGRSSSTAFVVSAALWGLGLLLTLTGSVIYRHYLIVVFPLTFVWLAMITLSSYPRAGSFLLAILCVAELVITVSFLAFIHFNCQSIRGDYGTPYSVQEGQPGGPYRLPP